MNLDVLRDDAYFDVFNVTNGGDAISFGNYLNQDVVVANIFNDSAIKTEKELFEKWNITEGGLDFNDEDSRLKSKLLECERDNYYYARSMDEFLSEDVLEEYIPSEHRKKR